MKKILFSVLILIIGCNKSEQDGSLYDIPQNQSTKDHQVMVLGTFHFSKAGDASDISGKYNMDMMSEDNQKNLEIITSDIIEKFDPTIIAIELRPKDQSYLDSLYQLYLKDEWSLGLNEVFQLGFRIAKAANLEGVYCVDNRPIQPHSVLALDDWEAYADSIGHLSLWSEYDKPNEDYNNYLDSMKNELDFNDYLRLVNSEENKKRSKELWFTGLVNLGHGDKFVGADLTGYWYQRNVRVFTNVRNLAKKRQERILVIYGYAHKWILDEMFSGSPEFTVISPELVLR